MGPNLQKTLFLILAFLIGPALYCQTPPDPPVNLPKPPPIPREILERKPPTPPPDLPDPSELKDQLKQLEELLSMTPEQLRKLRQTIEIIENKSDAERETMRIRLRQVTEMTDELRQEISRFQAIAGNLSRSDITQFWLAMEAPEREGMRKKLAGLPELEKKALLIKWVEAFNVKKNRAFSEMQRSLKDRKTGPDQ